MKEKVTYKQLQSNEINGLLILEIVSIPDHTILGESNVETCEIKNKNNMGGLLSEIYQIYRTNILSGKICDVSLELLWCTEKVENQPYESKIRLFLIIRYIGDNENIVCDYINTIGNICVTSLNAMKYATEVIDVDTFMEDFASIEDTKIRAVAKDESINNLQNQFMPICYSYDVIPENNDDLRYVINSLINSHCSAVSISLTATYYSADEIQVIGSTAQILDNLHKGIGVDQTNVITDVSAEKYVQQYKYYEQNKGARLFNYNILVYGSRDDVDNISAKLYGYINSD